MPSPTSSTRPVSRTSSCCPKSEICRSMMEAISLASSFNDIAASGQELGAEGGQPAADGAVVHLVPDLDHHAAEQVRVHLLDQHRLLLERAGERLPQVVPLVVGERDG